MTIIKTQILGQPFEIMVEDGLNLDFSESKIVVTKQPQAYWYYPYTTQIGIAGFVGDGPFNSEQTEPEALKPNQSIWGSDLPLKDKP